MDFLEKKSKDPNQYYYIVNNGKIKYYTSRNDKPIAKKSIPEDILSKIEKKDRSGIENVKALERYEKILQKIEKLEISLKEEKKKAEIMKNEINFESAERYKKDKKNIQNDFDEEFKDWGNYFKTHYKKYTYQQSNISDAHLILKTNNITNISEWKRWLVKHHPDKGGDEELCKKVISAGRAMGW